MASREVAKSHEGREEIVLLFVYLRPLRVSVLSRRASGERADGDFPADSKSQTQSSQGRLHEQYFDLLIEHERIGTGPWCHGTAIALRRRSRGTKECVNADSDVRENPLISARRPCTPDRFGR